MHDDIRAACGGRVRRIAVLRALKLGDLLCTVPAFRALRAAYPFAEIRLIGLPWASDLVRQYDAYLDGLFVLPGFPGMPEAPFDARAFAQFLIEVQAWEPDLVLQMHGSGDLSNPLALLLGGQTTAGYYLPGQYCADPRRFIPYPADLPEVDRHLRLLKYLGVPLQGRHKEMPVYDKDRRALADLLASRGGLDGPYGVIHPGASTPDHCWPPERFATVADGLAAEGLRIVLTGSAGEAGVTSAVQAAMRGPAVDLTGRTTLGVLAALLADAALLVSNDTGVMHLGEAVRTPLVAVSFDPESWRWAPADAARHRLFPGGKEVTASQVLEAGRASLCTSTADLRPRAELPGQTSDGRHVQSGRG
jgi:ADP-heptose:LPS heptosyltransferase